MTADAVGRGGSSRATSYGARHADFVPIGPDKESVMCYTHVPRHAVGAVVVCSPLFLESSENARAELLLADALAARGVATVRFDYRSCGHSHGAPPVKLASAVDDCLLAARHGTARTNAPLIGLLGTRWGAMVAARAAPILGAPALALWDPVRDGAAYAKDLLKTLFFLDFWADVRIPSAIHRERLAGGQPLDIRGWRVDPRTVAADAEESTYRTLPAGLLVRVVFGRRSSDHDRAVESDLAVAGCALSVTRLDDQVLWWWQANRLLEPDVQTLPFEFEAATTARWFAALASA